MPGTLRPKYDVVKQLPNGAVKRWKSVDSADIDSPFVLFPRKDPAAFVALLMYASLCEGGLSQEIKEFCGKIAEAEPVFGTQGKRNYSTMRASQVRSTFE